MLSIKTIAKEKMKSYIEECYRKEEASKLKGSQNLFQRLKRYFIQEKNKQVKKGNR